MSIVLVSNRTSTVIPNIVLAGLSRLQSVGSGHFVPKESTILRQLWEILKSGNIVVIIEMKHRTFPEIQSQQGKAFSLGTSLHFVDSVHGEETSVVKFCLYCPQQGQFLK